MTKALDDFVDREARKHAARREEVDWDLRRERWLEKLGEFYDFVDSSLKKYVDRDKVRIIRGTKSLNEQYIGSYEAPTRLVEIGDNRISLDPVGAMLIGAYGRVDMRGPYGRVKFALVSGGDPGSDPGGAEISAGGSHMDDADMELRGAGCTTWEKLGWTITTPPPRVRFLPLLEESFHEAILEVVNG